MILMPALLRCCLVLLTLAPLAACSAGAAAGAASPRQQRDLLTPERIRETGATNAYDVVANLRPHWLRTRGTDSFQSPTEVQVYLNESRLGGVETLRSISTIEIAYIRYFDGLSASARWGLDHGQGAIYVVTRPH